jgi:hypothetical protein
VAKRSELHERVFGGRRRLDQVSDVVEVLVKHVYLDPIEDAPHHGGVSRVRGSPSTRSSLRNESPQTVQRKQQIDPEG